MTALALIGGCVLAVVIAIGTIKVVDRLTQNRKRKRP